VIAGRFDAGILFAFVPSPGLSMRPIFIEPLCCAMMAGHALTEHSVVPALSLRDFRFIASRTDVSPPLRESIVRHCRNAGFEPAIQMEVQLQQTIVSLVGEGIGIAIVPKIVG
jgi:DNA-binding transcriptional LysR family regulator